MKHIADAFNNHSKVVFIFLSIATGAIFPQFKVFSPYIQTFLMIMLFYSFMNFDLKNMRFSIHLLWLAISNIAIGIGAYYLFQISGSNNALAAFVVGIAPTAISSTVVAGLIGGNVGYVSAAIIVTNFSVALLVPFLLPLFVHGDAHISTLTILAPVFSTLFWPFALTRIVHGLPSRIRKGVEKSSGLTYILWYATLVVVIAKASDFIFHSQAASVGEILQIAGISLFVCLINYALGALLGGKAYRREIRQALGHKNTTFVIWIALTYVNPLVALGPTFYILFHNIINSMLLIRSSNARNSASVQDGV